MLAGAHSIQAAARLAILRDGDTDTTPSYSPEYLAALNAPRPPFEQPRK